MLFPQKIKVVANARHINPHREVVVVQNDTAVEFLVAVIGDNGQTKLPPETSYVLTSLHLRKRPTQKLGVLQEDGNILFKLDQAELNKTGTVQAYIQAYHPEKGRVTSHPFTYHVAPDPIYGAEIRPPDKSLIEQVIGEGPAIIAEAKAETELSITERTRLTDEVDGALLEMSQSKDAADQSAQVAQQAADNADDERERLTLDVSAKLNEVETARSATVDATGEAMEAAGLARDEADAARLQKEEVQQILGAGPVASVNGETGVVTGIATQESMNQVTAQLAEKVGGEKKAEPEDLSDRTLALVTGDGTVNVLSEPAPNSVTLEKLGNELNNRLAKKQNPLSDYPVEIGVVGTSGTNSTANYGIRTVGYVKVSAGTRIRLTDYVNHKLRVAKYSLGDKTFFGGAVNLLEDYVVLEDCFIRVSVTNVPTSVVVDNAITLANKCLIDHAYFKPDKSTFIHQDETITLSYNPDGTIAQVVNENDKETITSSFSYQSGEVSAIVEATGNLRTTTTIVRNTDGSVSSINKIKGVV